MKDFYEILIYRMIYKYDQDALLGRREIHGIKVACVPPVWTPSAGIIVDTGENPCYEFRAYLNESMTLVLHLKSVSASDESLMPIQKVAEMWLPRDQGWRALPYEFAQYGLTPRDIHNLLPCHAIEGEKACPGCGVVLRDVQSMCGFCARGLPAKRG